MPNILITGGQGQIANALLSHEMATRFHIRTYAREHLDITQLDSIHKAITEFRPDYIINTAAYTAVDKAEDCKKESLLVNQVGAHQLALACQQQGIPLIHLSTDYVFDGSSASPYTEEAPVHPLNHYGQSKYLGEQAIREHCEKHLIVRLSAVFSEFGNNFYKTILRLAAEREELRIVADQITCPTYAGHIASALFTLIEQTPHWGTYHYCDKDAVSWYEFASTIIEEAKKVRPLKVKNIQAISTADYPTAAKRPAYSVLACHKIKNIYHIQQAEWKDAIQHLIRSMQ